VFSSEHKTLSSEHKALSNAEIAHLMKATEDARGRKRISPREMETKLLEICSGKFLPIKLLAELLGRTHDTLRVHYLTPMVKKGLLEQRFPDVPNHPHQGYRTAVRGQ
jgi:ATP-dependent DNA helicase RecG